MSLAQLISTQDLQQRLQQEDLLLLDCRFALEDPAYGRRSYLEGHLPGAHFLDLEQDLSAPVIKGVTGRHPLPDPSALVERLRSCGLRQHSQVVLYDDGPGAFAARAWWLLVWLGKRDGLYLLDGGLKAWREAGLELTCAAPDNAPGDFCAEPDNSLVLTAEQLAVRLGTADLTLLDARALPRFRGESNRSTRLPGIFPARSAPHSLTIWAPMAASSRQMNCASVSMACAANARWKTWWLTAAPASRPAITCSP